MTAQRSDPEILVAEASPDDTGELVPGTGVAVGVPVGARVTERVTAGGFSAEHVGDAVPMEVAEGELGFIPPIALDKHGPAELELIVEVPVRAARAAPQPKRASRGGGIRPVTVAWALTFAAVSALLAAAGATTCVVLVVSWLMSRAAQEAAPASPVAIPPPVAAAPIEPVALEALAEDLLVGVPVDQEPIAEPSAPVPARKVAAPRHKLSPPAPEAVPEPEPEPELVPEPAPVAAPEPEPTKKGGLFKKKRR